MSAAERRVSSIRATGSFSQAAGWAMADSMRDAGLDVLVHNAGVFLRRRQLTVDGYETTWAVNHLAPFLLTTLLLEDLLRRPAARVIRHDVMGLRVLTRRAGTLK